MTIKKYKKMRRLEFKKAAMGSMKLPGYNYIFFTFSSFRTLFETEKLNEIWYG